MTGAPGLYIITDRHATGGRPLTDVVASALAGATPAIKAGARVAVQLREKDLPAADLLKLARALRTLTADAGAGFYVNDRLDVALAVGADGVHLGRRSLGPADVRLVAPNLRVAISVHNQTEIQDALRDGNVAFAVFGPVYPTPGRGKAPPTGVEGDHGLRAACRIGLPLLALGGVGPGQVPECRAAGAAGVACIRAVMIAADPSNVVRDFMICTEF